MTQRSIAALILFIGLAVAGSTAVCQGQDNNGSEQDRKPYVEKDENGYVKYATSIKKIDEALRRLEDQVEEKERKIEALEKRVGMLENFSRASVEVLVNIVGFKKAFESLLEYLPPAQTPGDRGSEKP